MVRQDDTTDRSVPEVLQDIAGNIEDIARSELLLAKIYLKEELGRSAKASSTFAAGIVLAFYGLGFGILAAVYALATVVAAWLAALLVGTAVSTIALVLIIRGRSKLKAYAEAEKAIKNFPARGDGKWAKKHRISKDTSKNDATASTTTSAN